MALLQVFGLPDGEGVSSDAAFKLLIDNLTALSLGGGAGNGGGGAAAAPSSKPSSSSSPPPPPPPPSLGFDFGREYLYQEELYGLEGRPLQSSAAAAADGSAASSTGLTATAASDGVHHSRQWAVLRFDQPVTAPADSVVIGARFDADAHGDGCRLAFYGRILSLLDPSKPQELQRLRVYKLKERTGVIDRVQPDGTTVICRGLLKKESDVSLFTGLKVLTGRGEAGVIEGSFGKSGKLKIAFPAPLAGVVSGGSSGGGQQPLQRSAEDNVIVLRCKRYVFDTDRKGLRQ